MHSMEMYRRIQVHRSILTSAWIEPPQYRTNRLSNQEEL
jgi:hypothetical protein